MYLTRNHPKLLSDCAEKQWPCPLTLNLFNIYKKIQTEYHNQKGKSHLTQKKQEIEEEKRWEILYTCSSWRVITCFYFVRMETTDRNISFSVLFWSCVEESCCISCLIYPSFPLYTENFSIHSLSVFTTVFISVPCSVQTSLIPLQSKARPHAQST